MDAPKQEVIAQARRLRKESEEVALSIGNNPELPMREERSAALLQERLVAHGFRITQQFPLIPNAFVAEYGSGGPVIGLLAEYDALPDCGPGGKGPGHGCGHNLLGAASTYAAVALARVMEAQQIPGTVRLFGCPAEETLVGKPYMARDGAFEGLDACLAWHPGVHNEASSGSGTAMDSLAYEFFGRTAHAAGNPHDGRSALDAIEIMNVAVNFLREHVPPSVRLHYAIMDGGKAPNVVPSYARSWYYVRGTDRPQVADVSRRVHDCARGAALATGTRMKRTLLSVCYDRLANDAITGALDANLKLVGGPKLTKQDRAFAEGLGITGEFDSKVREISTSRGAGSSDEANVSWIAPLSVLHTACWAQGTPGHNYLVHLQSVAPAAMKGLAVAVQVLGLTAYDLLTDAKLLKEAREEFARRTKDSVYDPVLPLRQRAPIQDQIP